MVKVTEILAPSNRRGSICSPNKMKLTRAHGNSLQEPAVWILGAEKRLNRPLHSRWIYALPQVHETKKQDQSFRHQTLLLVPARHPWADYLALPLLAAGVCVPQNQLSDSSSTFISRWRWNMMSHLVWRKPVLRFICMSTGLSEEWIGWIKRSASTTETKHFHIGWTAISKASTPGYTSIHRERWIWKFIPNIAQIAKESSKPHSLAGGPETR